MQLFILKMCAPPYIDHRYPLVSFKNGFHVRAPREKYTNTKAFAVAGHGAGLLEIEIAGAAAMIVDEIATRAEIKVGGLQNERSSGVLVVLLRTKIFCFLRLHKF